MTARRGLKVASARLFWPIADFFRKRPGTGWVPQKISFERTSRFRAVGHRWALHCSIGFGSFEGAQASVMILGLGGAPRRPITPRSPELPFFELVQEEMKKLGYEGEWDLAAASFAGACANFHKDLRSAGGLEREWKLLTRLEFRAAR